jgi:phosphate-selective porin OprO/OprP
VRSRPEANPAPRFIDTGDFSSTQSNHFGTEIYYTSGPWMFGSEMYWHRFNSSTVNDPMFFGGEVVTSYMITGESRPYYTATSILGFVPVKKSFLKVGLEHGKFYSARQPSILMAVQYKEENSGESHPW